MRTLLFPIAAIVVFLLIAATFPLLARELISFKILDHWYGGGRARFDLVVWLLLHIPMLIVYYLAATWLIRRAAALTGVRKLRSAVLITGSLLLAGYLLYELWRVANPSDTSVRRLLLSVLAGAIAAAGIRATSTDLEADWEVDQGG